MDSNTQEKNLKIQLTNEPPQNVHDLLKQIFWKKPRMVYHAKDFLDHIKEWGKTESPYRSDEWKNYCTRKGLTQSQYHNMLKRLKRAGMIKKVYNKNRRTHEIYISEKFSDLTHVMLSIWDRYMRR
ncbi:MAG TPA: hypothetical protein EYP86_02785 [Candidatus Altiarchaeales archaeon]|nr:hypothetical protein [Candidatus Altiarchaeales archaeon]